MAVPHIYFDECVDHGLLARLQKRGFHVTTAPAERVIGVPDEAQLEYATRHDWMIVSTNTNDFQQLHRQFQGDNRPHSSILLLPTGVLDRMEIRAAMLLDWIATLPDYRSRLFRWHELQQRLIAGERIAGYTEDDVRRALGRPVARPDRAG